ncbi:sec-independent protein translocase protein TATB, chloroplastic-like [Silene latifolia]|uniref:sec-independent protein translocase protein TATB, chloroplastic-like n=1 Tax=Silene latifolia TaxID=37657 RepID=UPI003D777C88
MSSTALCTVSFGIASPVKLEKTAMFSLSICSCSSTHLKTFNFPLSSRLSQLGSSYFTPWNGLRYMGISISPKSHKNGRRAKCRGKGVYASLFGVGAPEALVIGVVALLVFGPKGLAEVAKNLGKTLRAFQPTIRELQDVSKEFKSTLEREIGLDDDPRAMRNPYQSATPPKPMPVEDFENVPVADPNGTPTSKAYTSEEYLKITEEQLKASAAVQPDVMPSLQDNQIDPMSQSDTQPNIASSPPESPLEPESQPQASQEDNIPSSPESKAESESQTEAAAGEMGK